MNLISFFSDVFFPNQGMYFVCVIIMILLMYPLLKKYTHSIIDPLFFFIAMEILANAIPLFLFITKNCSITLFVYFILSQLSFWLGFTSLYKKDFRFLDIHITNEYIFTKKLFYIISFMYIAITLLSYIKFGIPILLSNRNDLYRNSGGWGILRYFTDFLSIFIMIYSFYQLLERRNRSYIYLLLVVVITIILGGAKSGIMKIFYCYFFYSLFYKKQSVTLNKKYILILLTFPILILFVHSENIYNALLGLGERFVANGDCYIYAYPDNLLESIKIENPLKHIFSPFLRPARLATYSGLTAEPIGTLLVYESDYNLEVLGITSAPNTKSSIAGWIYFKWGGLIYSYILGFSISFIIYRFRKYFPNNILGIALYSQFYLIAAYGINDPFMFIGGFFTILLNLILLLIFVFIVVKGKIIIKHGKKNNDSYCCI